MVHRAIYSHTDLQALPRRSDEEVCVELVSLESVSIARESYALLRHLVQDLRSCLCPHLDILSLMASLSLELHRVEHDLLPPLQVHEAKLKDGAVLEALLFVKNSATTLLRLAKHVKEELLGVLEEDEDVVSGRVKEVGISLLSTADHVLRGFDNMEWLKVRVPFLLKLVNGLLATPVRFR
ncbi:unnamed protein product [Urochloa humidicola]